MQVMQAIYAMLADCCTDREEAGFVTCISKKWTADLMICVKIQVHAYGWSVLILARPSYMGV